MSIPHVKSLDRSDGAGAEHQPAERPVRVQRVQSSTILGAAGEAEIEHDGHLYRLRRTSRGGLVLTK